MQIPEGSVVTEFRGPALSQGWHGSSPVRAPSARRLSGLPSIVPRDLSTARSRRVSGRIRASPGLSCTFRQWPRTCCPLTLRGRLKGRRPETGRTKGAANYQNYHLLPNGGAPRSLRMGLLRTVFCPRDTRIVNFLFAWNRLFGPLFSIYFWSFFFLFFLIPPRWWLFDFRRAGEKSLIVNDGRSKHIETRR